MTHLDEAAIVMVRDGERRDAVLQAHLNDCLSCRERLEEARARARAIDALLDGVEGARNLEAAKAKVRHRLDVQRSRNDRLLPRGLRRAAAILLVSAGAAYALPGSPVPGWMGIGDAGPTHVEEAPVEGAPAVEADVPQEAVLVPVAERLEIRVEDVPAGRDIELLWLDGPTAWVTAGPGATYSVGEGSATVRAPGGAVRIGIPRTAPLVVVRVNGDVVFEGSGEDGAADRLLFPARGNGR